MPPGSRGRARKGNAPDEFDMVRVVAGLIDNVRAMWLTDYERGWIEGVYEFAHMRDGTYYVGTTGRTLDEAIRRFLSERGKPPEDES